MLLDIIHRYKPIIDLLAHEQCPHHARVILEVGSGNGGAQYVSDMPIINYDVNFTGQRLRHVRYVRGSANQLPFRKPCFNPTAACRGDTKHPYRRGVKGENWKFLPSLKGGPAVE